MKAKLHNYKIALFDLKEEKAEHVDVSQEVIEKRTGAIPLALYLLKEFSSDIVISAGLFSGTFVPSSSASVFLFKNEVGEIGFTHLLWHTGVELKYSGFDALVIKGKARDDCYLWVHDEIPEIIFNESIKGRDVWGFVDFLRKEHGDENIQIIARGEKESSLTLMLNYWYSGDIAGGGKALKDARVRGIAMRGMESFNAPEEFFRASLELKKKCENSPITERVTGKELSFLRKYLHRTPSCFNCPSPCYIFVMIDDDPKKMEESGVSEPGYLLSDPLQIVTLLQMGESFVREEREILKRGENPVTFFNEWKKADILKNWMRDIEKFPFSPLPPFNDEPSVYLKKLIYFLSAGICPVSGVLWEMNLENLFNSIEMREEDFRKNIEDSFMEIVKSWRSENLRKVFGL